MFSVTTGIVIKAAELEKGEVNNSSEFWIKPGKSHAIPVVIDKQNTVLCWEFTSQPKVCMTSFVIVILDFLKTRFYSKRNLSVQMPKLCIELMLYYFPITVHLLHNIFNANIPKGI